MSGRVGPQSQRKPAPGAGRQGKRKPTGRAARTGLLGVQQQAGNAAVSDSLADHLPASSTPPQDGIPEHAGQALSSPGRPLDASVRQEMEARFQQDFKKVQVHTGKQAASSADQEGARAYTVGRRIVFSRGEYAPGTSAGRQLVAHELAHVVQQSKGGTAPAGGPAAEREASGAAQASLAPGPAPVRVGTATAPGIARAGKKKKKKPVQKKPTMRERHEQHKRSYKKQGKKPKTFKKFGSERIGMGKYGPGAMRRHHLLPQEILKQKKYSKVAARLRAMKIDVHRWVADIPNDLHKKIHKGPGGGKWNKEILDWMDNKIKKGQKFTKNQLQAKINGMMRKHGFPKRYRTLAPTYGTPDRSKDFYKKRHEAKKKRRMERGKKKGGPAKKKKGPPAPKKPGKKPQLKAKKPQVKPKKPAVKPKKPQVKPKKPKVKAPKKPKVKAPKKFKPKKPKLPKGKIPKGKIPYYDLAVFVIAVALGADPAFGEGMSSEEAIIKALTEKGVKVSPELEELIKSNPALMKKLEAAAKKGKLDDESKAAAKRFYDFLQEHIDELDEETLERLIALGQGVEDPKLAATREQMEAALEAAKQGVEPGEPGEGAEPLEAGETPGAGGKGEGDKGGTGKTGAGKTGKEEGEEAEEGGGGTAESEGGVLPAGEKGKPGTSKIPPELRKRLKDAPEAVRKWFEGKTEFTSEVSEEQIEAILKATPAQLKLLESMLPRKTQKDQAAVDDSFLLRALEVTAGLTDDQLEKLLKTAKPVGKDTPEQVLKKLEAAVAALNQKQKDKKPGTRGEPAPGAGKTGAQGGKKGEGKDAGQGTGKKKGGKEGEGAKGPAAKKDTGAEKAGDKGEKKEDGGEGKKKKKTRTGGGAQRVTLTRSQAKEGESKVPEYRFPYSILSGFHLGGSYKEGQILPNKIQFQHQGRSYTAAGVRLEFVGSYTRENKDGETETVFKLKFVDQLENAEIDFLSKAGYESEYVFSPPSKPKPRTRAKAR
jgi:hypothetical protein